jgi:hypothetical protein
MTLPTITIAMADGYFATTPRNSAWVAVVDKQIELNEANRWLGALCYDQKKDCCGRSFDAAYTEAVSELALALSQNPTSLIGTAAASAATGQVKRQKLGDLEVEYHAPTAGTVTAGRYGANAPFVLQRFPWLGDIVGCWLKVATGSSRVIARVRS